MKKLLESKIKIIDSIKISDVKYGDLKLNVFPYNFCLPIKLPYPFDFWNESIEKIKSYIPLIEDDCNTHYITIDTQFFMKTDYQRREGLHIDGNFCADPSLSISTWSGIRYLNGKIKKGFEFPYDIEIPTGEYISGEKGGIFLASTEIGCKYYEGEFMCSVHDQGFVRIEKNDRTSKIFYPNTLYFMTSNTPHEAIEINAGKRRTLVRVTLNHNYPNEKIFQLLDSKK